LAKIDFFISSSQDSAPYFRVFISCSSLASDVVCFYAGGSQSVECLERAVLTLGLEQTEAPPDQSSLAFKALESRVAALEMVVKGTGKRLRSFISFKFDDPLTIDQVDRLKRLLAAVQIEWLTGEQFEPRRIEDKVKSRLRADVDFVIAVISKAGESKWIRDELADANARGLWIVLLLEEGATFDKGIFGSLEYLRFGLAIEQTFPAVLEGVNFIRAEISNRIEHHKA
jgi:hypothetical protein